MPERRRFRLVLGAYLVLIGAFIAWTAKLVIVQVFLAGPDAPLPSGAPAERVGAACATGLHQLGDSLDVAVKAALWERDEESAMAKFGGAAASTWGRQADVEQACAGGDLARGAFAAMLRERRVQESWVRHHARETMAASAGAIEFLPVRPLSGSTSALPQPDSR